MTYNDFLNAIIDDGIEEVRQCYIDHKDFEKRDGAILGFSECRDKNPEQILELLDIANIKAQNIFFNIYKNKEKDYWYWRYRAMRIEWVLNVLSAYNHINGLQTYITPTIRGMNKAIDILGIKSQIYEV